MAKLQKSTAEDAGITLGIPRVGVRSYMSSWALRSARRYAAAAQQIEEQHEGEWASPYAEEHMELVISAVINSVVFLEAMVNEIFQDALENHGIKGDGYIAPLSPEARRLMASWWEESEGRTSILSKYQLLLSLAGSDKFARGSEPYQSVAKLVQLRNAIVHYKPETIYSDMVHMLEGKLKGRYPENALVPIAARSGNWWPSRALSAGCAKWAYESAEKFADELSARLDIRPSYMRVDMSLQRPE